MLQFINNHPVKLIVPAQHLSCMVLIQFNIRKSDQTGSFQDFKPMTNTEIIKYMEYFLELSDCDIIQGTFPPCCKSWKNRKFQFLLIDKFIWPLNAWILRDKIHFFKKINGFFPKISLYPKNICYYPNTFYIFNFLFAVKKLVWCGNYSILINQDFRVSNIFFFNFVW